MATKASAIATRSSQDDWEAEADLRTMLECEKIEKDPRRMAAVQTLAKQRLLDLASIASESASE
jgi:hypothetical protein